MNTKFNLPNATTAPKVLPDVSVFEHENFQGWQIRTSLDVSYIGDPPINDATSSIVVHSGTWQFFEDVDFIKPLNPPLGPGYYKSVRDLGWPNDSITSFKIISY